MANKGYSKFKIYKCRDCPQYILTRSNKLRCDTCLKRDINARTLACYKKNKAKRQAQAKNRYQTRIKNNQCVKCTQPAQYFVYCPACKLKTKSQRQYRIYVRSWNKKKPEPSKFDLGWKRLFGKT
jgi:hypothetical protein